MTTTAHKISLLKRRARELSHGGTAGVFTSGPITCRYYPGNDRYVWMIAGQRASVRDVAQTLATPEDHMRAMWQNAIREARQ